jgi:hypothetical protein
VAPGEIHRWPLVVTTTMVITVNVATEIALDTAISIRGPSGNIVAQQNNTQGAEPEVLAAVPLNELGTYEILITSENDVAGFYAILVLNEESYTFVFNGTLAFGEVGPAIMRANTDQFWHFSGTAGQVVTITATPSDNSDLFMRLFGPNDTLLVDFHDDTGQGDVEEIESFTLPETGFYSLLIGEFDFGAASYTVVITIE